jgi:hypothetical protein
MRKYAVPIECNLLRALSSRFKVAAVGTAMTTDEMAGNLSPSRDAARRLVLLGATTLFC